MGSLIIIVALFALLWILLIRPQRAKQRQQESMLNSIAPGDEVLTVGGLYGIVHEVEDDGDLVVEIAEGIHARVARRAVAGVEKPDDEPDDEEGVDETAEGDEPESAGETPVGENQEAAAR